MRNRFTFSFITVLSIGIVALLGSCEKDYIAPMVPASRSFTEEFDTVANLYAKGWIFNNNSKPQGAATWQQGVFASGKLGIDGFPAFSYKASGDEYVFAGYAAGDKIATISSWMITPEIDMKNGDQFSFYTRTYTGSTFPDRLQVRLNSSDNTANVGFDSSSVGKFTTLLSDINSRLTATGYPQTWTKYTLTVSGLSAPGKRRVGFRYYVTNGGPNGANSNAIGIDKFEFLSQ